MKRRPLRDLRKRDISARSMNLHLEFIEESMEQWLREAPAKRAAAEAARIARGPTEADVKLAKLRRARGMEYSKWALGEI
jgi:hypothetical protein